jgi:hypothetical protein
MKKMLNNTIQFFEITGYIFVFSFYIFFCFQEDKWFESYRKRKTINLPVGKTTLLQDENQANVLCIMHAPFTAAWSGIILVPRKQSVPENIGLHI